MSRRFHGFEFVLMRGDAEIDIAEATDEDAASTLDGFLARLTAGDS